MVRQLVQGVLEHQVQVVHQELAVLQAQVVHQEV
jgi:hypothetical protein